MEVSAVRFSPGSEGLLTPLLPHLSDKSVSEILINRPGEVFVEKGGEMYRFEEQTLTASHMRRLFQFIANENHQRLDESSPLLSGNLYDGSRVQLVIPPVATHYTLSIRRPSVRKMTLADYRASSFYEGACAFGNVDFAGASKNDEDAELLALYRQGEWADFMEKAVLFQKNIVISGETSSGKTTFLNALMRHIPASARIITLEDTRELDAPHQNRVSLCAPKKMGHENGAISMQDLVQCSLRLRPDRLIMGEIRGAEIMDFVSACATGHEGSITSIHAPNPRVAMLRMIQMYKLNNVPSMRDTEIESLLREVIDIILQVKKTTSGRRLLHVYFKAALSEEG